MDEGFDRFRNTLTSHLDQSSTKKGGLLGLDRDERTGLLIGSAIGALMSKSAGINPLVGGLATYSKGVDQIYNQRQQQVEMDRQAEKDNLAQMNSYINYQNAQTNAQRGTQGAQYPPASYDSMFSNTIIRILGKPDSSGEWYIDENKEIAQIANALKGKYQRDPRYRNDAIGAAQAAIWDAQRLYREKQLSSIKAPDLAVSHTRGESKEKPYGKYMSNNRPFVSGRDK